MAKIAPHTGKQEIVVKTKEKPKAESGAWWNAANKSELADQLIATASFLKEQNLARYRQAAVYARLYSNMPLFGFVGNNLTKMGGTNQLPIDRPTMSVITSCIDTIVSRIEQSRPQPLYLTDNGDYKQRKLAKQINEFIRGEFYQTQAYQKGTLQLRDSCVLGTGVLKVYKDINKKVAVERRLCTELLVDANDAMYGEPRQMYEVKLVDRSVLAEYFPKYKSRIEKAQQAYPESGDSSKTVSDQIMVAEGFHLRSGPGANDGLHVIACSEGLIFEESYEKDRFPYVFLHNSPRMLGFWGQGTCERLMGTQMEINKLLITISKSINLVGVPRVFVEDGSKVVSAHLNNDIGSIIKYQGTKPIYEVAPCVPQELYAQLERLVQYAYQQEGVSAMAAGGKKAAGLNSGEAIREYNDLQTDRFASLEKRVRVSYEDLAKLQLDVAIDIVKEEGSYQTVYPTKDGTRQIDFPDIKKLVDDPFVIQCYDVSSLPNDPAGRLQRVTELMQAGIYTPQEGRRLLGFPDTQQVDKLENAGEERILKILDGIIEGKAYEPPDPFMNLQLAEKLVNQYYNLYTAANLEESKAQKLRTFFSQVQALKAQAAQAMAPMGAPSMPQAVPMAPPQSELIPNVPNPGVPQ